MVSRPRFIGSMRRNSYEKLKAVTNIGNCNSGLELSRKGQIQQEDVQSILERSSKENWFRCLKGRVSVTLKTDHVLKRSPGLLSGIASPACNDCLITLK